MPATTPIASSKSAALTRILDAIPRGYQSYTYGTISAAKAEYLAKKFHQLYGVGLSRAQRLARKKKGRSNTLLVMYWPDISKDAEWVLMATSGTGLEENKLNRFDEKPRFIFLGYELSRHTAFGKLAWTWKRSKQEMTELHLLIESQAGTHNFSALASTLERIVRQPGFHGVNRQSQQLLLAARRHGYSGELPKLFYLRKVSHGEPLQLGP